MTQIKSIILEPEKDARIEMIDSSLEELQKLVGGYIEVIYPFEFEKFPLNRVAIICNENGKIERLPLNRALYDEDGSLYDVIAGTAVLVGIDTDDFVSLNEEQEKYYFSKFEVPEGFFWYGPRLLSFPILPIIEP